MLRDSDSAPPPRTAIRSRNSTRTKAKVQGGGGIQPDIVVEPPPMNRLRAVLDPSASFNNFATEYLSNHAITPGLQVSGEILDQFRSFLSDREIRPGIADWSAEPYFIANRLKTELFNQAFGRGAGRRSGSGARSGDPESHRSN
jgi:hypothetical protein